MTPQKYRRKMMPIEAVQITAQNAEEVAAHFGTSERDVRVHVGDWVLRVSHNRPYFRSVHEFAESYEPVAGPVPA